MSIISDQMQGMDEDMCAESERKERRWERKTGGHIMVPGTQGEGCGVYRLRGFKLNPELLNL